MLTRRPSESIMIGDDIKITVTKVNQSNVSIGIEAPRDVAIHRQEIYDQLQEDRQDGAATKSFAEKSK